MAADFLDSVWELPVVNMQDVAPVLYASNARLQLTTQYRTKLRKLRVSHVVRFLSLCLSPSLHPSALPLFQPSLLLLAPTLTLTAKSTSRTAVSRAACSQTALVGIPECDALLLRDLGKSLMYLADSNDLLPLSDLPVAAGGAFLERLREAVISLKALAQLHDMVWPHSVLWLL